MGLSSGMEESIDLSIYASTISYDYGTFDLVYQRATNVYNLRPDGTVVVVAEALYGPDGPGVVGSFRTECTLGDGFRAWSNGGWQRKKKKKTWHAQGTCLQ